MVDTGGIDTEEDIITKQVREQAENCYPGSRCNIFVVDGRDGLTGADEDVATLRRTNKEVILCVNKVEEFSATLAMTANFGLGLGDPIAISAEHGRGVGDLFGFSGR